MEYDVIIGLEVHAQLLTETKIFCSCPTTFGDEPNTNTCPVCIGMPGILPVLNKKIVDFGIKLGIATHCKIAKTNIFARKNYFYPDLPKGYQITQYESPLCEHGFLDIDTTGGSKRIGITRIHMEEDAGKLIHDLKGHRSFIDFNRAGVPLLEIVSEPDMRSTDEADTYLRELRQLLVYLEICDGNMEQGSFRCDANISVRPKGSTFFGVRTELKNMNSFRNVHRALSYEIKRHIDVLRSGREVTQQTMLWGETANATRSMRTKEESHDYRYFPEPDLVPVMVDNAWIGKIRKTLPEMPRERRKRFEEGYGLPGYDADILTQSRDVADYFEDCVSLLDSPKEISNWIMTEVLRVLKGGTADIKALKVTPRMLTSMIRLIDGGAISGKMAKDVFNEMAETGKSSEEIVKDSGLKQISDEGHLKNLAKTILEDHKKEVGSYKKGKTQLIGFFVGQLMKATKGKANPELTNKIIKEILEE
ncbi:MAG: Asp-tRNA(Asn)/Glu-tRNA(Gln) amidotransferase subunit GatB [Thermodesulfobacteriota bacterium]|nr:Asp-tRNA(Asn)/Glu-tRNA(Gln) amidotransferase subunit GatB [Thermodesulfobacteriota bacterium]